MSKASAIVTAVGMLAAIGACGSSSGSASSPTDEASTSAGGPSSADCRAASGITLSPMGPYSQGQQGTGSISLKLTNAGEDCSLRSFPTTELRAADGTLVGLAKSDAYTGGDPFDHVVPLPSGGSAYFSVISKTDATGACDSPAPIADQIIVKLPGDEEYLATAAQVPACDSIVTIFRATEAA